MDTEITIAISITGIATFTEGKEFTFTAEYLFKTTLLDDRDFCYQPLAWYEGNCEMIHTTWEDGAPDVTDGASLLECKAVAEEFNFDVDYDEA